MSPVVFDVASEALVLYIKEIINFSKNNIGIYKHSGADSVLKPVLALHYFI